MCEITLDNYKAYLPEIEDAIENCKFISIDTEFSCINLSKNRNSLFDSMNERYKKLRQTVMQLIPMQIGLSFFKFNPDENTFTAQVYTFYVFPRSFGEFDPEFICKSSAFQFLCAHGFDFNKFVYNGLPFLNQVQEGQLRTFIESDQMEIDTELEYLFDEQGKLVGQWISGAKIGDTLLLPNVQKYAANFTVVYLLHRKLRERFLNHLKTFEDREGFKVEKINEATKVQVVDEELKESVIQNVLGFTHIFRQISECKKPIIGHNCLLDFLILLQHFHNPLPPSYVDFKRTVHDLFPNVFDTKTLSFELKRKLDIASWPHGALQAHYEYFKNGTGRSLSLNGPAITASMDFQHSYHDAGFDSFCTGYIFIRMAHIAAFKRVNVPKKTFMSTELLQEVSEYKNWLNIIQGNLSHICLDGIDPISKRPPWLVVETKNNPMNVSQVSTLLSPYGFAEIRPVSPNRAIIAVDNFWSVNKIVGQFKSNPEYKVQTYSSLKHNPVAKTALWGGVLLSTSLGIWFVYSAISRSK